MSSFTAPVNTPRFITAEPKDQTRHATAKAIQDQFGADAKIAVFVLPHYGADCAKVIDKYVPHAAFYGTARISNVAEKVSDIRAGKIVSMQGQGRPMTVSDYIKKMSLTFDAAWLDYEGDYNPERDVEIGLFAQKMLKRPGILAVTMQGDSAEQMGQAVKTGLQTVARSVSMLSHQSYTTKTNRHRIHHMIHLIFLLEN